jgi:NAD(P)-dependent dehydrogenase (short-subunit alcohol dehydrogenase family)
VTLDIQRLFGVAGKVALVTGGSSGIGLMIAAALAANGVRVYIAGRRQDRLDAAVAEISRHGECIGLSADLSGVPGCEALAAAIAARESKLHILVNNAGNSWGQPLEDYTEAGWDRVMDLNLKGAFFLTQKLLPLLEAAGTPDDNARIVSLSSVATGTGDGNAYAYNTSKAALEQLTRMLARSLAGRNVTANAMSPGWYPTKMNAPLGDEARDVWLAATPVGRLGTPEDAGGLILFLCSRAGAYINGQTIITDGGRTL